ncbi:MAG: CHRD domain-containing protein [Phycisphaerae bacterium]
MFAKRALFSSVAVIALVFGGGCPNAMDMSGGAESGGDTPTGANAFFASLSGDQEVPPVDVAATGTAALTLNDDETEVVLDISASGFTVPVTMMHLHGGALGENGSVILDLTDNLMDLGGGMVGATGSVAISPEVISALRDGTVYLNMHTADNPAGEIRGQFGPPA